MSENPEVVSPYVGDKLENHPRKEDKNDATRESDSSMVTPVMAVFALVIVIVLIYYTTTCFGVSKDAKTKKKAKVEEEDCGFDVIAEVEKLRKKQDEYKARCQ